VLGHCKDFVGRGWGKFYYLVVMMMMAMVVVVMMMMMAMVVVVMMMMMAMVVVVVMMMMAMVVVVVMMMMAMVVVVVMMMMAMVVVVQAFLSAGENHLSSHLRLRYSLTQPHFLDPCLRLCQNKSLLYHNLLAYTKIFLYHSAPLCGLVQSQESSQKKCLPFCSLLSRNIHDQNQGERLDLHCSANHSYYYYYCCS
jgi:hypothetical protein